MSNKIVQSESEFEEIQLDLDDLNVEKPKEVEEELDLNGLDLDLELDDPKPTDTPTIDSQPTDKGKTHETSGQAQKSKEPPVSTPEKAGDETLDLDLPLEELEENPTIQTKDEIVEEIQKPVEPIHVDLDLIDYNPKTVRRNSAVSVDKLEPRIDTLSKEYFDPKFDIAKLKTNKYQTRRTQRSEAERVELANKIARQGQLEPIHVHREGDEYQIIAGFGRHEAMMSLKVRHIKAIIHCGLNESEIVQLSFGSNEGRTELSEWDKICSVGSFLREHPLFPIDDPDDPNSLVKIFGYAKDVIYRCLKFYKYYSMKPEFVELFKQRKLPTFVYEVVYDSRGSLTDTKRLIEYLKGETQFSKKSFENTMYDIITDAKMDSKLKEDQKLTDELGQQISGEDKTTAKILMDKIAEDEKKNREATAMKLQVVIDMVKGASEKLDVLLTDEHIKNYVDSKQFKELNKLLKKLNQNHLKLY